MRVLLEIDAGELPDEPEELFASAHLVHLACGGHAGDEGTIELALRKAKQYQTLVGAHPSFPDRARFGRVAMELSEPALRATVFEQCALLGQCARRNEVEVHSLKPHGALYHSASHDLSLARTVVTAALEALGNDLWIVGPADSALHAVARERSLRFLREGFADRAVRSDGTLVPRTEPNAVLTDESAVLERLEALLEQNLLDAVCLHGDTPGAARFAKLVRARLDELTR